MMTGLSAFNAAAVSARAAAFGTALVYNGKTVTGSVSAQSTQRKLSDGGYAFDPNTVIRIPTSEGVTPAIGDRIKIKATGVEFVIDEVETSTLNPEIKLTVRNASL